MGERDNHFEKVKRDIVDAEKDVERFSIQVEELKSAVMTEAFGITRELERSGSKKAGDIFISVREEIGTLKERAQKEIEAQISEARKDIGKESEALAINVMEKILDRRLAS
jgi:F-type H+-transporting ATPase subunit b